MVVGSIDSILDWTIWFAGLLALACAGFPTIIALKMIGEYAGILSFRLPFHLFRQNITIRAIVVLSCMISLYFFVSTDVLLIFFIASIPACVFWPLYSAQYGSALSGLFHSSVCIFGYEVAYRCADFFFDDLAYVILSTLVIAGAPSYLGHTWYRAAIAGSKVGTQNRRDRRARRFLRKLASSGPQPRFSLILRPFLIDDAPGHASTSRYKDFIRSESRFFRDDDREGFDEAMHRYSIDDTEAIIMRAHRKKGPVFAVGQLGAIGAGRIPLKDETWKHDVTKLLLAADRLFVIASNTPGTLWEMRRIYELGLLSKTIFVKHGNIPFYPEKNPDSTATYAENWDTIKSQLPDGFVFPYYGDVGDVFTVDENGVASGFDLNWKSNARSASVAFREILNTIDKQKEDAVPGKDPDEPQMLESTLNDQLSIRPNLGAT